MKINNFLTMAFLCVLLASCIDSGVKTVSGFKPIYGSVDELSSLILSKEAQSLKSPGKIYVKGDYLFINEVLKGVHVFDNSNPSSPIKLNFISIPGNVDIAMKGNYLYADYLNGLATIDVSDIHSAQLLDFNFEYKNSDNGQHYPPAPLLSSETASKIYFQCPVADSGIVIGWEKITMPEPQCYVDNSGISFNWREE
jgi:hypothetical protein